MVVVDTYQLIDDVLFAVQWDGNDKHCMDQMLDLFTDAEYLRSYLIENERHIRSRRYNRERFIRDLKDGAIEMLEHIHTHAATEATGIASLDKIFEDLGGNRMTFSYAPKKYKGISYCNELRVYAIKNDYGQYFITGFAIKFSQEIHDHPDTELEYKKMVIFDNYLKERQDEI